MSYAKRAWAVCPKSLTLSDLRVAKDVFVHDVEYCNPRQE